MADFGVGCGVPNGRPDVFTAWEASGLLSKLRSAGETMNRTVPWTSDLQGEGSPNAATDPLRRADPSRGDRRDAATLDDADGGARSSWDDHRDGMKAIAAQMSRLFDGDATAPSRDDADCAGPLRPDVKDALRGAVAEIARRQAALDAHGAAPPLTSQVTSDVTRPSFPAPPAAKPTGPWQAPAVPSARAAGPSVEVRQTEATARDGAPHERLSREPSRLRRAGIDLSAEVSQTFARFSQDLHESIRATDARPSIDALDRHVRQIGRAVDGLGVGRSDHEAIARIGEQTREMRDLLRAEADRSAPLDAVERQVATLEARLGRLADQAVPPATSALPPGFGDTMAEVRALLDGFKPGAALMALETRLDDITGRIERGLDARGPAGLIEGLSRRVDEIHASLRSQLAQSALDTRPLEGLVRGLSDRIGQAREASTDFQQLEDAVRDVAAKLDGAAGGIDPRGAGAIETQLARLAERLERSEASLKALDGVESSLGELFSQFEVTRQVAIDAAETAARTAARDTLRAALQNPGLAHRPAEAAPGLAEQVSRGLDELRAFQDSAERRTQTTLAEIRTTIERLAQGLGGTDGVPLPAPAGEPVFRRGAGPRGMAEPAPVSLDPVDVLIEPGFGRSGPSPRVEPRPSSEAERDGDKAVEGDGPTHFIAAARRAAQAAQASAVAEAVSKRPGRRPAVRGATRTAGATAVGLGTVARAKQFLAQRRRPVLLGLATVVLLVGALEVVKFSADPSVAPRIAAVDVSAAAPAHVAGSSSPPAGGGAAAAKPAAFADAVLPPAAAVRPPPLPSFVAGPARAQPIAANDGIPDALRSRAAAGDAEAQYEVALRYADGQGVARDAKQAAAWFGKAAAQGLAIADYRLGSAYEKGVGVDRDPALAMGWYGKAADAGNIRAMHNLAVMSAEGAAGKPDYAKAAQWFGKAATFGVRDSEFNLAILYARGLGIEQSLIQSYTWFAIAAAGGDDDAAKKRDEVGAKLDPQTLASAKAAADAFHPAVPLASANDAGSVAAGADSLASPRPAPVPAKVSQL